MTSGNRSPEPGFVRLVIRRAKLASIAGDFKSALQDFAYAEDMLFSRSRPVHLREEEHAEMARDAQYGVATSLLCMQRVTEAQTSAVKALSNSFADTKEGTDRRRFVIRTIAEASGVDDFARAWRFLVASAA